VPLDIEELILAGRGHLIRGGNALMFPRRSEDVGEVLPVGAGTAGVLEMAAEGPSPMENVEGTLPPQPPPGTPGAPDTGSSPPQPAPGTPGAPGAQPAPRTPQACHARRGRPRREQQ